MKSKMPYLIALFLIDGTAQADFCFNEAATLAQMPITQKITKQLGRPARSSIAAIRSVTFDGTISGEGVEMNQAFTISGTYITSTYIGGSTPKPVEYSAKVILQDPGIDGQGCGSLKELSIIQAEERK